MYSLYLVQANAHPIKRNGYTTNVCKFYQFVENRLAYSASRAFSTPYIIAMLKCLPF